ncbi:hypothetical protein [Neisseria cinerea]|uniref:hypothetical protein n=1 Tax=Neisseria cinerea TaxID=483 RepID=UPI002B1DCFA6|nr:hypothetical protein [Neisseria cinerea]
MHLRIVFVKMPSETDTARFQTAFLSSCLYPPSSQASDFYPFPDKSFSGGFG